MRRLLPRIASVLAALALAGVVWTVARTAGRHGVELPRPSNAAVLLLVAVGWQTAYAVGSVRAWRASRAAPPPRRLQRLDPADARGMLVARALELYVLFMTMDQGLWRPAFVGLEPPTPPWTSLLAGASLYLLVFLWSVGRRVTDEEYEAHVRVLAMLSPRGRTAKRQVLAALTLNPLTEELLSRGVIVLVGATLIGAPAAVLLGLVLCLGVHLYQGPATLPFHGAFFLVTVALAFSPLGLWGAIGLHLVADLWPSLSMRAVLTGWRDRRRLRRLEARLARERRAA